MEGRYSRGTRRVLRYPLLTNRDGKQQSEIKIRHPAVYRFKRYGR